MTSFKLKQAPKFSTPKEILADAIRQSKGGKVLFMVTPSLSKHPLAVEIKEALAGIEHILFEERINNPTYELLEELKQRFYDQNIRCIIVIGAGSYLDTAKILSIVLAQGNPSSLLELSKKGDIRGFITTHIPIYCMPSSAGSGAESTPFASIWDKENKKKYSIHNELMLPEKLSLMPSFVVNQPLKQRLFSGLDAISHAVESIWNNDATTNSLNISVQALGDSLKFLPQILSEDATQEQAKQMMNAALAAGMAIGITRTALAHSISYPLTAHYNVPHGLACSFTLPAIYRHLILRTPKEERESFASYLKPAMDYVESLNLKQYLKDYLTKEQLLGLVDEMNNPQRFGNFLYPPKRSELIRILNESY